MADEDTNNDLNPSKKLRDDGPNIVYVETVNGYAGPYVTLTAPDLKAYTTAQADAKFTVPIASATVAGKVRVGAGLTIDANGVLGTNSAAPDWSAITNKPTSYPPTKAGTTVLGGIKVGVGLTINDDGTLNASGTAPEWATILNKPAAYPPTAATATQIGGVKPGAGLTVDANGVLNSLNSVPTWDAILDKPTVFPPPIASDTVLGGVKEGTNIEIDADGSISARVVWDTIIQKPLEFPPTVATKDKRGGVYVGDGLKADESGVLSLTLADYNNIGGVVPGATLATDGVTGRLDVVPASKENFGAVKIGDTLYVDDKGFLEANPGAIQPATADTLGGVKIGTGVNVTEEGVISVPQGFPFPKNHLNFSPERGIPGKDGVYIWEVPENCEVFRVTVVGSGGSGGQTSNKGTGGTGGGGGGWAQATFFGLPKGTKFKITAGKQTYGGRGPDFSHPSLFQSGDGKRTYLTANGGQNGFDGVDDTSKVLVGAVGGVGSHDYDPKFMTIPNLGTGGDGGWAACINNKPYAGLGGSSLFCGPSWYSGQAGGGGGGGGINTQDGSGKVAAGQDGIVIIEY